MSVINQMLRELDQRNNQNNRRAKTILPSSYLVPENNNKNRIMMIGVITVFFTVLAAGYYFKFIPNTDVELARVEDKVLPTVEKQDIVSQYIVLPKPPEIKAVQTALEIDQSIKEPEIALLEEQSPREATIEHSEASTSPELQRVVKLHRQPDSRIEAERLFKSARRNVESNQFSAARRLLNQALEISPDFHNARVLLFSLLLQQQQTEAMEIGLEQSLQQWPDVHEYKQMKARLFMQQAKINEALEILVKDIPDVSVAPEYHALLAYVAQQTAKDQLAKEHYQLLLQQHSSRADWWLGLAVSEERLANKESALQAYRQAIGRPGLSQSVRDYARQRIKILQGF